MEVADSSMRKIVGKVAGACAAFLMLAFMAGCGGKGVPSDITGNALAVDKEGQVRLYLVDQFDKEYYDLDELTAMATEEAAKFNGRVHKESGDKSPLTMEEVKLLDGEGKQVRLVFCFSRDEYYSQYGEETLHYETMEVAAASKHVFIGSVFLGKEGGITLDDTEKAKLKANHVIVTDAKTRIYPPEEVLYYSHDAVLCEDGSIDTTGCEDTAVLILKK